MKRLLLLVLGLLFVSCSFSFGATILGVATDSGYAYADADSLNDEYVKYFTNNIYPAADPDYHGFVIGASGSKLSVFVTEDILGGDIYLMSNLGYDNGEGTQNLQFGSQVLNPMVGTGQLDGYRNPAPTGSNFYYGVLLSSGNWVKTSLQMGGQWIYTNTDNIYYSGQLSLGDYFFSAYDADGNGILTEREGFSPKTKSATHNPPIPEPGTLALMFMGLMRLYFPFQKNKITGDTPPFKKRIQTYAGRSK